MGCGSWDTRSFVSYSTSKGYGTDARGIITGSYSNQEMFKAKNIEVIRIGLQTTDTICSPEKEGSEV